MTSFFFLLLFFWLISFGYLEGWLNADATSRQYGNYLMVNLAAACVLILLYPFKLKYSFPGVKVFTLLIVWLIIIHFFQPDYFASLKRLVNILLTQVLLVVLANYAWKIDLFKLVELFIYYVAILMVVVIYVHLTKIGPIGIGTHLEEFRLGGAFTFGQAATLAGTGLLLCAYQILYNPAAKKILFGTLALFFVYCLIACDLRTAIGAVAVALCIQYLFYLRSKKKNIFPFLILISAVYGAYKLYVSLNESGNLVSSDLAYREIIWNLSIPGIARRPITGYGSVIGFYKNNPRILSFHEFLVDPHSSYLAIMLQSGVVTFVLLMIYLFQVARFNILSASYHTKALVSVFAFWLLVGSTGGYMYDLDYDITSVVFLFSVLAFCCHPSHIAANKQAILNKGMLKAYV